MINKNEKRIYNAFLVSIIFTIIFALTAVFYGMWKKTSDLIEKENIVRARSLFSSIVTARLWNASYSAVYVEKTKGVFSNPYLKNPDLICGARVFTMKNPATMTREISQLSEAEGLYKIHITGLFLLNPANKPDPFESYSLKLFEKGKKEFYKTEKTENGKIFRYMAPLYTKKECLKCHTEQNYKIGDVRGGISITFTIDDTDVMIKKNMVEIIIFAAVSMIVLLIIVYHFTSSLRKKINDARKQIISMATMDPLTFLYNRRHIMERFTQEASRSGRKFEPIGCIMIDIDDFKKINDTKGHLHGDRVIREVAKVIKNSIRAHDVAGRYGGEEFLIMLPKTNIKETKTVAERIRKAVSATDVDGSMPTVSVGITEMKKDESSIETVISRADNALYKAKRKGKNRVESKI